MEWACDVFLWCVKTHLVVIKFVKELIKSYFLVVQTYLRGITVNKFKSSKTYYNIFQRNNEKIISICGMWKVGQTVYLLLIHSPLNNLSKNKLKLFSLKLKCNKSKLNTCMFIYNEIGSYRSVRNKCYKMLYSMIARDKSNTLFCIFIHITLNN